MFSKEIILFLSFSPSRSTAPSDRKHGKYRSQLNRFQRRLQLSHVVVVRTHELPELRGVLADVRGRPWLILGKQEDAVSVPDEFDIVLPKVCVVRDDRLGVERSVGGVNQSIVEFRLVELRETRVTSSSR